MSPKRTNNKSLEKSIVDFDRFEELRPQYLAILENLTQKFGVEISTKYAKLVNFQKNIEEPIHSWFNYKQGYSDELVTTILQKEKPPEDKYILDPFVGVGTTCLVAQRLGYNSVGFDINPVAVLAARVKSYTFSSQELKILEQHIEEFEPTKSSLIPKEVKVLDNSYTPPNFEKLMGIKGYCEGLSDSKIHDFFLLAYITIVEDCSNRIKDGNGLKIAKNKPVVQDVYDYFLKKAKKMISDILTVSSIKNSDNFMDPNKLRKPEVKIINDSFIGDFPPLEKGSVGCVIFSPPYANCFDYFEVFKLEMWMGGFVNQYSDFRRYRDKAVRSHVNASFDHNLLNTNKNVDIIASLVSCFNIWNKNIPDMIRGYFDDMTTVLQNLSKIMIKGAKCFIIVGNSGYRGVLVPTDLLIAEIALRNDFQVEKVISTRELRASSQQSKDVYQNYKNLMRESIVVLTKIN